jgi:hypothetical protein
MPFSAATGAMDAACGANEALAHTSERLVTRITWVGVFGMAKFLGGERATRCDAV